MLFYCKAKEGHKLEARAHDSPRVTIMTAASMSYSRRRARDDTEEELTCPWGISEVKALFNVDLEYSLSDRYKANTKKTQLKS